MLKLKIIPFNGLTTEIIKANFQTNLSINIKSFTVEGNSIKF